MDRPDSSPGRGALDLAASPSVSLAGRRRPTTAARRDLAQSLAQGTSDLIAEVRTKLPQAEVVLQVDEPALPVVLAGAVPTEGGFFRHRSIDRPEAAQAGPVGRATPGAVLHCCASGVSAQLVGQSGFGALSVDRDQVDDWEGVAGFVDGGGALYLGCLPTATERAWSVDQLVGRALEVLRPLELGAALAEHADAEPRLWVRQGFAARGRPPRPVRWCGPPRWWTRPRSDGSDPSGTGTGRALPGTVAGRGGKPSKSGS